MATKTTTPQFGDMNQNLQLPPQETIGPMSGSVSNVPTFEEQQAAGTIKTKSAATPPAPTPSAPTPTTTKQPEQKVLAGADTADGTIKRGGNEFVTLEKDQAAIDRAKAMWEAAQAEKQAETAPAVAESTSKQNPDGSATTETKDYTTPESQVYKKQLDDALSSIDTEITYAKSKYEGLMRTADAAQAALMESIEKTFEVRKYEMERINKAALNTQQLLGARSGRQRYAPEMQSSILSEEERAGLVRLTEIEALELQTIAAAQQAATEQDFMLLNGMIGTMSDLREEKNTVVRDMYDLALKEQEKAQSKARFELEIQQSTETVKSLINQNMMTDASIYASSLIEFDQDTGKAKMPSDDKVIELAEAAGYDAGMLLNAVRTQAMSLTREQADVAKAIVEAEMAQYTDDQKEYRAAVEEGYLGSYLDFVGTQSSGGVPGGYYSDILVARLGKQIYGTRISDKESERIQRFVEQGVAQGKSEMDIIDDVLGYNVQVNQELGESLRDTLLQAAGEGGLSEFDMLGLARLLNENKTEEAIRKVELEIQNRAKIIDPEGVRSEAATRTAVERSTELEDYVLGLGEENPIGVVGGTMTKWIKKKFRGQKEDKIMGDVTQIVAEMRNKLLGSAVTESESKFLEPLIPELNDTPENFMQKLQRLQKEPLRELNNYRETFGMPALDEQSLENPEAKVELYKAEGDLVKTRNEYDKFFQSQTLQQQQVINQMIADPDLGSTEEERMKNIMRAFDFSVDLSTSVKGIKDGSRVTTSIGSGIVTGIERGSSENLYGLDIVIDGGYGAPVNSAISGQVVSVGPAGGFGNQVKIKDGAGREWTFNHLLDANVYPGQKINQGTLLGLQGNTGTSLTWDSALGEYRRVTPEERAAGRGTHLDITVYKPDGSKYTSQEVAAMLNTKQLA